MDASLQNRVSNKHKVTDALAPLARGLKTWWLRLFLLVRFPFKLIFTAISILTVQVLTIGVLDLFFAIAPQTVFVTLNVLLGEFFFASLLLSRRATKRLPGSKVAAQITIEETPVCKILTFQRQNIKTYAQSSNGKDENENL